MNTVRHTLAEIDEEHLIAFCVGCDTMVKIKPTHSKVGKLNSKWRCKKAYDYTWAESQRPWKKHKKEACEECGFFAKHPSQLDVDHVDGDKANNDISNLRTLCKNCHSYKTAMKADWIPKKFSQSVD